MSMFALIGIGMAALSTIFWILEAKPAWEMISTLQLPRPSWNPFIPFFGCIRFSVLFLVALFKAWRLPVDITCTLLLISAFSINGATGMMMGLTMSNIISFFLLKYKHKGDGHVQDHQQTNIGSSYP